METATKSIKKDKKKPITTINIDGWEIYDTRPVMPEKDFLTFCLQNPNMRIEQDKHGNIFIMSPVSLYSGHHESIVSGYLFMWNLQQKKGKTYSSSTLFIMPNGEKRMPDAAWVSNERLEKLSQSERKTFAHLVPDFVVEVRSPTDRVADLKNKMKEAWIANGVGLAWLIDPVDEVSWVYRKDGSIGEFKGLDKALDGEDVLPGFTLDLSVLKDE
ncbi:MAG: Uma2 family endonuclease [Saprospiraceae bacterium]